ncbi:MAG TPA: M56 family metallopeptidase [Steroidobacteraceae bacterium]|nr:M56 family metallopeptidase [Steroidobacteraceae bacterium]
MTAEVLRLLAMTTLSSSLALLIVGALRRPLRRMAGARAAAWLWLLVPVVMLAVLLPAPSRMLLPPAVTMPAQIQALLTGTVTVSSANRAAWIPAALALWAAGVAAMILTMTLRQRAFHRSLGTLSRDARGLFRGEGVAAPMLVGVWRPRIVVPADFESRYTTEEQDLVLAHERAHARRGDVAVNLLASLMLCVFWFNPLVYRALAWLRMDQELACDAAVLARHSGARRPYADALLKTQLASEAAWRSPMGCHWQSSHPLKERILMLKLPLPGSLRRLAGAALVVGLTTVAAYTAWAGQPAARDQGPPILVDLKVTISNPQANEANVLATRYLVHSGEEILDAGSQPLKYACTPYLPDEGARTTDWSAIRKRGIPVPPAGQILVLCSIRDGGEEIAAPAVMMADGKPGAIETAPGGGALRYRLDISATTSAKRIDEARELANKN